MRWGSQTIDLVPVGARAIPLTTSLSSRQPSGSLGRVLALQEPTVVDEHLLLRLAALGADGLHRRHHVHALQDLAEDHVLAVEPGRLDRRDEELGAVRVRPGVRHAEDARPRVLQLEALILELGTVDTLSAGAIAAGEVTTLEHEVGDDAVELAALEMQRLARLADALAARAQVHKVLDGLGDHAAEEPDRDALGGLVPDLDVKVHLVRDERALDIFLGSREEREGQEPGEPVQGHHRRAHPGR
mmetsp:Transcript_28683/g.82417  ORF Transcript_28683/g.82417 Transcript_28683/m.82417 type:complete len:244 (-) Transcript_28683:38-769(-)